MKAHFSGLLSIQQTNLLVLIVSGLLFVSSASVSVFSCLWLIGVTMVGRRAVRRAVPFILPPAIFQMPLLFYGGFLFHLGLGLWMVNTAIFVILFGVCRCFVLII